MTSFSARVYALCAKVPKGRVTTYRKIAKALKTKACRAVGHALHGNRHDFVSGDRTVPCHRVVKADGSLGGFAFGSQKKKELLEREGITVKEGKVVDFKKVLAHPAKAKQTKNGGSEICNRDHRGSVPL